MGSPISHMQSKQVSASVPLRRRTPQRIARRGPTEQPYAPWRRFRSAIFVGSASGRYPAVRSGRRPTSSEGSHELSIFQNRGGMQGCRRAASRTRGEPGRGPNAGGQLQRGRPADVAGARPSASQVPGSRTTGSGNGPAAVPRRSASTAVSTGSVVYRNRRSTSGGGSSSRTFIVSTGALPWDGGATQRGSPLPGVLPSPRCLRKPLLGRREFLRRLCGIVLGKNVLRPCASGTQRALDPHRRATQPARPGTPRFLQSPCSQTKPRPGKESRTQHAAAAKKRGGRGRGPTAQPMAGITPKAGSPTKVGRFALAVPRRRTRFSLFVRTKTPAPPDGRVGSGAFCGQPQGRFRAIRRAAQVLPSVIRSAAAAPCFVPAGSGPGRRRERVRAPRWLAPNPKFPCPSP